MTKEMILTKKKKAQKIIIDGQKNRDQACRQGGAAFSTPSLNNQLSVGLKVNGRVHRLVRASVARGIIVFLFLFLVKITYQTFGADGVKYPTEVGKNEFFVMNDFRSDTDDSRQIGSIKESKICGKLLFLIRRRGF